MAPRNTSSRWLGTCLNIFLGVLSMNAAAEDSGTVKGKLTYDGNAYTLQHVYAWQPPERGTELWIYVTDAPLPAAVTQDHSREFLPDIADLQDEGRLHGVTLYIDPTKPDLDAVDFKGFTHMGVFKFARTSGGPKWKRLLIDGNRVAGTLQYGGVDMMGLEWSLDLEFSAPVAGAPDGEPASADTGMPDGEPASTDTTTLTGEQAQKSPQAEVFLAYETALLWQGIDAAGAYMTRERLANMHEQIAQFGADGFKEMQTQRRATTPQGEARRAQIEKVVVDGDNAVLEVRNGPNDVDVAPLANTEDGWKIAK
jgi:hypothetical protein